MSECWSLLDLGDEDTISKNNETINNPAMHAPITIFQPLSLSLCCCLLSTRDSIQFSITHVIFLIVQSTSIPSHQFSAFDCDYVS